MTRDLIRGGQLLKIEVIDHVIMGNGNRASLRELGCFAWLRVMPSCWGDSSKHLGITPFLIIRLGMIRQGHLLTPERQALPIVALASHRRGLPSPLRPTC